MTIKTNKASIAAFLFAAAAATIAGGQGHASDVVPAAGTYVLDATHTALLWSVKHNKISNYTGRFEKVSGTLVLDPVNVERSTLEIKIDPASVQVAYPANYRETHPNAKFDTWRETVSRDPQMLNSSAFPEITFKSTAVKRTGPKTAAVTGNLSFLGVTKPVTLATTLTGALDSHPVVGTPVVAFAAETTFDRTQFGQPVGYAGTEVTVRFDGEFVQPPAAAKSK